MARLAWTAASLVIIQSLGTATDAKDILGVTCSRPPVLNCSGGSCPDDLLANPGNAVERKTGRRFFLDYPCRLKPGDKVTLVLALHGGGLTGNWMRHYFPIMDFKDRYKLIIATPTGTGNLWTAADDDYLRNIVEELEASVGKTNITAFWLAGHSLGGQTANRLINSDPLFSPGHLTGWVSLSGGRLGSKRGDVRVAFPPEASRPPPIGPAVQIADASLLPERPFSFIYETGEHELTAAGLPSTSKWATKLGCGTQSQPLSIIDASAGHVYDDRAQSNPNLVWGREARPGSAQVYLYPSCAGGRVVADIVRLGKGHTEGLEPHVTEEIVKLMTRPHGSS